MSPLSTASASVSSTVLPLTATGSVSARLAAVPPTATAKSVAAGSEPASVASPPSKVTVSVAPFTAAEENAGGVLLVSAPKMKSAALLPDRSVSGLPPLLISR